MKDKIIYYTIGTLAMFGGLCLFCFFIGRVMALLGLN